MNNKTFNTNTEDKLSGLFSNLPEVFFWTVIVTRLFIAVPLFLAAQIHFAFLGNVWMVNVTSLASVLIIEAILTLPSLSTAFFRAAGLKQYERVAFWTTIILGGFNMLLIYWSFVETNMHKEAFIMYTVLNLASIVLAEFIGYMVSEKNTVATEPTPVPMPETQPKPIKIPEDVQRIVSDNDTTLEDKVNEIKALGYKGSQIALFLNISESTVSRFLKR